MLILAAVCGAFSRLARARPKTVADEWSAFGLQMRTPAQRAGLVAERQTLRDIFVACGPMCRVPWLESEAVRWR